MKKKSLILFPLLFLMGCSQSEIASSSFEYSISYEKSLPIVHRDASGTYTYLLLTRYGRAVINDALVQGSNPEGTYFENCVKYEASVGSPLPEAVFYKDGEIKEDVTFRGWYFYQDNENVNADKFTTVPDPTKVRALCALFDGPTGGSGGIITEGYGIKFTDGTKVLASEMSEPDYSGRKQYMISNYSFAQGKAFALYDFGKDVTWTIDLDPYSFGGTESSPVWNTYLSKSAASYTVLKSFTADLIIKLRENDDQMYIELK